MKLGMNKEIQEKAINMLKNAEDKSKAITEVFEMLNEEANTELIKELQDMQAEVSANAEKAKSMGLRNLNAKEKEFYEKVINQSITFTQGDIIPTDIVDYTLKDLRETSSTLQLVNFAPANVKKWIIASKTGKAAWGGITDELTSEISATFRSINIEDRKLHAILIVPKAVRELSMQFVDKYFRAVLAEVMHDGLVEGYLTGNKKTGPIGIMKKVDAVNEDSTAQDKTVNTMHDFVTGTPAVKKYLSNDGKRKINKLYMIANPSDVYDYVEPSLYFFNGMGYVSVSKTEVEVIEEPMMEKGKAVFTIPGCYTMGLAGVNVTEYKETKAIEDADVLIAKAYANGRATDDNTAYVINVTQLKPYIPEYKQVTE